jgi:hypothetical protein
MESKRSWTLIVVGVLTVSFAGYLLFNWWTHRRQDLAMRDSVVGECTAQLGAAACKDHLDRYHDDCARLTRTRSGKYSGAPDAPNHEKYLSCVVLGVDAWVEDNGRKAAAAAQQRRADEAAP